MPVSLSPSELATFREKGCIVPDYRLPAEVIREMRAEYQVLLANNPNIATDILLGPHQTHGNAQGLIGSEKWLEFATHPDLLDMASELIGDDIILWGTTIFGKPARSGKESPWHQDGDYYPIRPLETLTMWIPMDDVTPENGPMRFIPGSHQKHQLFSHSWIPGDDKTINLACDEIHFDANTAEYLLIKAGQVSFHDVYLIHGSTPNRSDARRAAFVVRLMPASSHYDHALGKQMEVKHPAHAYGSRPLFLVRGKDTCGKNDFMIGH